VGEVEQPGFRARSSRKLTFYPDLRSAFNWDRTHSVHAARTQRFGSTAVGNPELAGPASVAIDVGSHEAADSLREKIRES
jgi:hypothetical protein